jgi:hypothetical protein
MRRSLQALLLLGLLALIGAGATSASAAHRSAVRAAIVCPGGGPPPCCVPVVAQPRAIPCCLGTAGPNIIPCCVPTVINCPGITIASSRDPSTARQSVNITGRLATASSAGATVTLWQELPGQQAFHSLAQTQTDSTGNYTLTRPAGSVKTNRSWYVSALALKSLTLVQMVKAVVSLTVSAKKTGAGETVTFKGKVAPSHAGARIRLQVKGATGWRTIASVRLTAGSTFSMRESFLGSGSALVRATLGADSRNIVSYSRAVHTKL